MLSTSPFWIPNHTFNLKCVLKSCSPKLDPTHPTCFENDDECLFHSVAGGFTALAVASFIAAVKLHHLTERIANFQEIFQFLVLEEQYEGSFWLCVASATAHGVNLLLIALSAIRFPEFKTKTEEANVTAEDIMY